MNLIYFQKKKEEVKKEGIQVETITKVPLLSANEVITISSDSEVQVVEDVSDTALTIIEDDKTDGFTETVEMGSSMMQSTDIPDDNVLETIEELGLLEL